MRINKVIPGLILLGGIFFNSCIRDEAPNMEADIESTTIPNAQNILQTEPVIEGSTITYRVSQFSGSYIFAPEFKLTSGATISPASGTKLDFSQPQKYIVTSQDGAWSREYTVTFIIDSDTFINKHSFENVEEDTNHYHKFYELINGQKLYNWSSGNQGFSLIASSNPSVYPTYQISDGYKGNGVRLVTRNTGRLGVLFGNPIAAGNIFLGYFQLAFPTVRSTKFGIPYSLKKAPKAITGYFKYAAGANLTKTTASSLTRDSWNAYAILFEKRDTDNFLLGDHSFKDARMVSVAKLKNDQRIETNQWTKFEIPFEFVNGNSFDSSKEYMFTIVFTSSIEGEKYNGAVGSTLDIDEIQIVTE